MIDQLERLGKIFKVRLLEPLMNQFANLETDAWDALAFFLRGYAFERQGRSPNFAPAAVDTILTLKHDGHTLMDTAIEKKVWQIFHDKLCEKGLNERNNPLSPQGTRYKLKTKKKEVVDLETRGISAVEFVQKLENQNLVVWAKQLLATNNVDEAWNGIIKITGVRDKIASLFLRDIAVIFQLSPQRSRKLLQPVDIWVRRTVRQIKGDISLNDSECAKWIVDQSLDHRRSPEAVNQGIWYLATQIVQSEYSLDKLLKDSKHDPTFLMQSVRLHLSTLHNAVSLAKDWQ